jgi:hypothetical protein
MNHHFEDHPELSRNEKAQILWAWTIFMRSGFEKRHFTPTLHKFLSDYGPANFFGRNIDLNRFWEIYFDSTIANVWLAVRQFSRQGILGEGQDGDWWDRYESPLFGDLMQAMVEITDRYGWAFQDIIDLYEIERMQIRINEKLAHFDQNVPEPSPHSREIAYQAIYEAEQLRAASVSYPMTDELRRRLRLAAGEAVRPVTQPALFGNRSNRSAGRPGANRISQSTPPPNLTQNSAHRSSGGETMKHKKRRSSRDTNA